ncbi:SMC-Scp complex subunit ScpB [Methylocystis rosea]|uniref:SMC-Scp complex subunit ScpB n=1 Tax=Methylocystis rosea TaxID=173366 RepID=A0A3G8MD96_9HYPH|nr:SMC-Scp complex subunit ScpB [Methylocystis rosea]AZG78798.1 SMC-Scp complex subunit ScpB [Methylocystis rosea]
MREITELRSMKTRRTDATSAQETRAPTKGRTARRDQELLFDADLVDLPQAMRWREWMGRVEAAIFASPAPVTREALAKLVGRACNFDDLICDIRDELRARPYELVHVAGGYQLRTKARYADAIRALNNGARAGGPPQLTPTELLTVTAIAYLQPATRAELSRLAGREISRDVIGSLKSLDLIAAGPRAPQPGAPYAYVTTKKFLEVFGLASLRDLPDIEKLEDAGLLQCSANEIKLDGMLDPRDKDAIELVEDIDEESD